MAAASATLLPRMPEWEGTHCRATVHPSEDRRRRALCMVCTNKVEDVGWCERRRWRDERESVYMTALPLEWAAWRWVRAWCRAYSSAVRMSVSGGSLHVLQMLLLGSYMAAAVEGRVVEREPSVYSFRWWWYTDLSSFRK